MTSGMFDDFGKALGCMAIVVAVAAIALYELIRWAASHLSIGWN